jgi:preprotein translocase subunit SecF
MSDRPDGVRPNVRERHGALHRIYRGETKIDFIGKRKIWFLISTVVLLACIAIIAFQGLTFGIEFEGGIQIQAPVPEDGPLGDASNSDVVTEVRSALEGEGADDAQIQVFTSDEGRGLTVQSKEIADPESQEQAVDIVSETVGAPISDIGSQRIGSKWGGEITRSAIRALIIFIVVVFAFISWRFEWKMAVGALAALIHDLLVTAGVYALVGFEVTPSTVIALLTILGYSLYDTIVVFDKVEEDTTLFATTGKMTYEAAANVAMNEVFMRSLNTSLATLLPVGALLVVGTGLLGASTLKDLALALLVGILSGTYSSVFVATPVLTVLKEREPRYRNVREKVLREAKRQTPAPALAGAGAASVEAEPAPAATSGVASGTTASSRPPARARVGTKKSKRRKKR